MDQRIWWQPGKPISVYCLRPGDDRVRSAVQHGGFDLLLSGRLTVRQQDDAW